MPKTPFRILMVDDSVPQLKARSRFVINALRILNPEIQDDEIELITTSNAVHAFSEFSKGIIDAKPFNLIITDYEMPHPHDKNKNGNGDILIERIRSSIKNNHDLSLDTRLIFTEEYIPDVMLISTRDIEDIEKETTSRKFNGKFLPETHPYLTVTYQKKGSKEEQLPMANFISKSLQRWKPSTTTSPYTITELNRERRNSEPFTGERESLKTRRSASEDIILGRPINVSNLKQSSKEQAEGIGRTT
jgi:CheY-like chemotaxis protein